MKVLTMILLGLGLTAPVQEEAASEASGPSPAEIHLSHVMKSMNGPPDRVGLLEILEAETAVAVQHAELMASDPADLDSMKRHAAHVGHAIDPASQEKGPGKGYGLEKAAGWVEKKSVLMSRSEGVTDSMTTHSAHVRASAANVAGWAKMALAEIEKIAAAETAEVAAASASRVRELVSWIENGTDADGDGRVSWQEGEGGVAQVRQHLELLAGAS